MPSSIIQKQAPLTKAIIVAMAIGSLSACGSGGGGGSSAAAPETVTSVGVITAFGSIFVNGVKFETDTSTVSVDGNSGSASQLKLGMVVKVSGSVNADGITGIASNVSFNDEVQGPVTTITTGADGIMKTLTILGSTVHINSGTTIFDGVTFSGIAINDVVEVSGFIDGAGDLQATRIEKKEIFVAGVSEVEMKGIVTGTTSTTFTLNGVTIDFSGADISDIPSGTITDGLRIEVKGTLIGSTLTATEVEIEDDLFDEDEDEVELENIITGFISVNDFKVAGQSIDASSATLKPAGLILQNGLQVEVEGSVIGGVLIATEIEAREGDIKAEATVQSVDISGKTITLRFSTGNVVVMVDSLTIFEDELNIFNRFTLADIRIGDFLKIHARDTGSTTLLATEIKRDSTDDDELQGPVDGFTSGSSITLLGITLSTLPGTTAFEDSNDTAISSAAFYAALMTGETIEMKDNQPADGIADKVELED